MATDAAIVRRYLDTMMAHDWDGLRACLTDDFARVGPHPEHLFPDPDAYVAFLAAALPEIEGHTVEITHTSPSDGVVYVEVTERFVVEGRSVEARVCMACELAADGRLQFIEAYLRRPAEGSLADA